MTVYLIGYRVCERYSGSTKTFGHEQIKARIESL